MAKINDIDSFKFVEYIKYKDIFNIFKNIKDEYTNKMPTNNMIESKLLEYTYLRICNVGAWIINSTILIFVDYIGRFIK